MEAVASGIRHLPNAGGDFLAGEIPSLRPPCRSLALRLHLHNMEARSILNRNLFRQHDALYSQVSCGRCAGAFSCCFSSGKGRPSFLGEILSFSLPKKNLRT